MEHLPLPALVEARRRLCGELLASAAVHSAISDEIADLDAVENHRPLTPEEQERRALLRARKRGALLRHDAIERRLRRLAAHLRATATEDRRALRR